MDGKVVQRYQYIILSRYGHNLSALSISFVSLPLSVINSFRKLLRQEEQSAVKICHTLWIVYFTEIQNVRKIFDLSDLTPSDCNIYYVV